MRNVLAGIAAILICALLLVIGAIFLRQPMTEKQLIQAAERGDFRKLRKALNDKSHYIRLDAVKALLKVGSDESYELLITATHDKAPIVRIALLSRIHEMPKYKALPIISVLIEDSEDSIAFSAVRKLEEMTGRKYNISLQDSVEKRQEVKKQCKRDIEEILAIK